MRYACFVLLGLTCTNAGATQRVLDAQLHHLRALGTREWATFPEVAELDHLEIRFAAQANESPQALELRQQDVKQLWNVRLNGQRLGQLHRDENDLVVYLPIAAGMLRTGENVVRIEQEANGRPAPDDIRVGQIVLHARPMDAVLSEAALRITVVDGDSRHHLPARITVVDHRGALQMVGAESNEHLAVRPGTIYTANGHARFGLPPGRYTVYAGRGFEYSLDRREVSVQPGDVVDLALTIRREVPTEGYVACDTHVHSLTHSGHGDATVEERMVTLAAEGIELPIATDHNVHIDHEPFARTMNVRQFFTPVIGNEVTTRVGHFNVFPIRPEARPADHTQTDWPTIFEQIFMTEGVRVAILNHPRDLHSGVRPFGPKRYNWLVAENLNEWPLRFNGVEVLNSSATQHDIMRLFHDWMALLNRGYSVTPVGSSDSHDVARHFVGQGRTYIRCDDGDPGKVDVARAVDSFLQGAVLVSYGLLAEVIVDGDCRSGDIAPARGEQVSVTVRVLGPHWTRAAHVELFANGSRIREATIGEAEAVRPGVKWQETWTLPRPKHDVHLVAIARGPGIDEPYWKTAKPYQSDSIHWNPRVIGCSGAVWLDVDGDGQKTSARDYAQRLLAECGENPTELVQALSQYDEAVAAHAAHLYSSRSGPQSYARMQELLAQAAEPVRVGFNAYYRSWQESQRAQLSPTE